MDQTVNTRKRRAMSQQYMDEHRDELRKEYSEIRPQSKKSRTLTKKERKALGIGKDQGFAVTHNVRTAPVKANLVCKLIRGKDLDEAYAILAYTPRKVAPILSDLLRSAEANAVNNNELDRDRLYVASCTANPGIVMKRIQPRARGSADRIHKRTSHLTVVLKERA